MAGIGIVIIPRMTTIKILLLLAFSFIHAYANEQTSDCGEVNLSQELGEIRNQSNVGWCFANTAADLLTVSHKSELFYHFQSQAQNSSLKSTDLQVSSIFSALHYFRSQVDGGTNHKEVFNSGGYILDAIQIIQQKGFICPQSLDVLLIETGSKSLLKEKFIKFEEIYSTYQDYIKTRSEKSKEQFFRMIQELESKNTFLSAYNAEQIKSVLTQATLESAVMKLLDLVCENKKIAITKKLSFEKMTSYGDNTNTYYSSKIKNRVGYEVFQKTIDKALDNKRPLGIAYNVGNVLKEPKISSGAHASVISGRKLINNECFYQIRNSWGEDCTRKAFINEVLIKDYPIYSYSCVKGTFWVPQKDLKFLLDEIVYEEAP